MALVAALCERLRVPAECRDLALIMAKQHGDIHLAAELRPGTMVQLLQSADAFRKPERFARLLQACESDSCGRLGYSERPYPQAGRMAAAFKAAAAVDAGAIAKQYSEPSRIKDAIYQARVAAVRVMLNETDD